MKKVLSFILVLSMVLGSFGMAFAAPATSDIAGHLNEKAILRLNKLGIVQGDDRGFAPDASITRAEFAVLVVRALGLEGSANVSKGETQFTDVTMTNGYDWATGAINVATRLGYIQGYGNGKFGPGDNIKYEDAITLLVRILGYEPAAQEKGGYPVGYLVVAEQDIDMTDHVKGSTGEAATRGAVFQLLDNALTKPLMIQTGYGDEKKYVVSGQKGTGTEKQTILTDKLGIEVVEGIVTANYRVDSKLKANQIKIGKDKYEVTEEFDVDAILGLEVSAWQDKDDVLFRYEVETDEDDILYDTVKSNKEDKKALKVELTVKDDKFAWSEFSKTNETEDAVVYVNNEKVDVEDVPLNAYGRFVLNDYKEVAFAYLYDFDADMVGMALELNDDEIEFVNLETAKKDVIGLDDAEEVFVLNPDLTKADLKDIEKGTAVFGWEDEDDNFFIVIKNEVVEGTLEAVRVSNNRVTVGGKNISKAANAIFSGDQGDKYDFWKDTNYETVEDFIDEEVMVVLDLAGKAMVLTTDAKVTSSDIYGVATYLTEGRNPVLSVFTNEGKEVEYKFEENTDANDVRGHVNLSGSTFDNTKFAAVKFRVNKDGEIVKNTLKVETDAKDFKKLETKDRFITSVVGSEKYNIRQNTIVIKALNNSDKLKPSVIKYDDIIGKTFDKEEAFVIGDAGKDAKLIVFTNSKFQAKDDSKYGVVTGEPEVQKGGDYKVEVDVAGEGKVTYVLSNRKDVRKGDLVRFTLNNKGELVVEGNTLNAKDGNIASKLSKVTAEVDDEYLEIDGKTYLVDEKETPIYKVDKDGALEKNTVKLSRIKKGDIVLMITDIDNSNEIKVLVVVTEKHNDIDTGARELEVAIEAAKEAQKAYEKAELDKTAKVYTDVTAAIADKNVTAIKEATAALVKATNEATGAKDLAAAIEAAEAAQAAYEKADGDKALKVYTDVTDAIAAEDVAEIKKATEALEKATKALEEATKALEAAVKAAEAAQAAYEKADGDKTAEVYTDVTDAIAAEDVAEIKKATEALEKATKALEEAAKVEAAVEAVNNATSIATMRKALEENAKTLGLDMTLYNTLDDLNKDIVADAMIGTEYENASAIVSAFRAAVRERI
ncbi:S-layer homology domain-containing protein [Alkaliphilus sp. B6464]|uniref:S-layer homology domain-containing protein n=1 Tax=Alkaliphilus sp. B6464 TaxID=2731219 RepID=UPI001BA8FC81|nr:S-layer homology domain-containing protein [Alkaliphilus sp. B6464]QUH19165.1 S-layer homology domain-containing protein [Alkaliphilus sp. B6464]